MSGQVRERTPTSLTPPRGPNDGYVGRALIAGFYCYGQLISVLRDTFEFGDDDSWRQVYDNPFRQFPPVVEEI